MIYEFYCWIFLGGVVVLDFVLVIEGLYRWLRILGCVVDVKELMNEVGRINRVWMVRFFYVGEVVMFDGRNWRWLWWLRL